MLFIFWAVYAKLNAHMAIVQKNTKHFWNVNDLHLPYVCGKLYGLEEPNPFRKLPALIGPV